MKKLLCSLWLPLWLLAGQPEAAAQAQPAPASADQFVMQDHELGLRKGTQFTPLTRNAVLANGVKINYQSGAVEYPDGRRVVLKEGDAVTMTGEVVLAKPATLPPTKPAATKAPAAAAAPATVPAPAPPAAPAEAAEAPAAAAVAPAAPAEAAVPAPPAASPAPTVSAPRRVFAFRPAEPTNGKLKGVVELGGSGFNSFVVRVDAHRSWKLEKAEFGNNAALGSLATDEDVRKGLKTYLAQLLESGVGGRDIHFVTSAAAAKTPTTQKLLKGLKTLGYTVAVVTPQQEGTYALRATLPTPYAGKAFVSDIGSSSTKISWLQKDAPQVLETFSARYYETKVPDAKVTAEVEAKAKLVPAPLRSTCFVIGAVPHELAKAVRQGQERYTVLGSPESYPQPTTAKARAGLTIYQALAAATNCQQFVFDWDAHYSIGYLLTLPY